MNKWEYLRNANAFTFVTASEYTERLDVLEKACQSLRKENVAWALSCSTSLFFQGIVDDFNDFDILVDVKDIKAMEKALMSIGIKLDPTIQKRGFASPYYQEAHLGDVHFDLIGDITLNTFQGLYCYPVKKQELEWVSLGHNIFVPMVPVESSLCLYGMMEGWQSKRRFKRELCYEFLKENGLKHPEVLEKAMSQNIPDWLKEVIGSLL